MKGKTMVQIRKTVFQRELITSDALGVPCEPICRVAVMAVVRNPLAGQAVDDLSPLFEMRFALSVRIFAQRAEGHHY